jgi:hypothetical protein
MLCRPQSPETDDADPGSRVATARAASNISPIDHGWSANRKTWPSEDQEEPAEYAREIEARRTGVYRATAEELRVLDEAEQSGTATDEEVEAAFRTFRRK